MSVCGTGLFPTPDPINPDLNASSLTATPGFSGIHVRWTLNATSLPGVSHTQIYRGESSDFGLAVPLHRVKGDYYFDPVNDAAADTTYFYWIRHYDTSGQEGNLIGPASATLNSPIEDVINALEGQIDNSHLSQTLKDQIAQITILDQSLANETLNRTNGYALLTAALDAAASDFEGVRTAIISETNERQTADAAQVDSINLLGARVDGAESVIINQQTVIADLEQSYTQDILALGGRISDAETAIVVERSTRATADETISSSIEAFNSRLGDAEANISEEIIARVNRDTAIAASINNLDTSIDGRVNAAISKIDLTSAAGYCEIGGNPDVTKMDRDSCEAAGGTWKETGSIATSLNTYAVANDTQVAALQSTTSVHGDDITGLKAEYVIKSSVSDIDGKPLIGGFGLYNDGNVLDAAFEVDRFWIGSTGNSSDKPFIVDNGNVYIKNAFIQDAAIDSAKIGDLAVQTAHIENLSVGSIKIADEAVSTTGAGIAQDNGVVIGVELDSTLTDQEAIVTYNWLVPDNSQPSTHVIKAYYYIGNEVLPPPITLPMWPSWIESFSAWLYSYTAQSATVRIPIPSGNDRLWLALLLYTNGGGGTPGTLLTYTEGMFSNIVAHMRKK